MWQKSRKILVSPTTLAPEDKGLREIFRSFQAGDFRRDFHDWITCSNGASHFTNCYALAPEDKGREKVF